MTNQAAQTMPELPEPDVKVFNEMAPFGAVITGYTADQMHQYAREYAAILAAAPAASGGEARRVWQCPACPSSVEYAGKVAPPCPRCDTTTELDTIAKPSPPAAALVSERARESDPLLGAYMTWPDDIRKKLSMHDLRRMGGWAPRPDPADWRIDTSAGGPILVYQDCSVIEGEQARYVLGLIAKDTAIEQALTQQRGECVGEVANYGCAPEVVASVHWHTNVLNLPIGTKLYTTPQPSADAVRELVK